MIRRMARKNRGPVIKPKLEPGVVVSGGQSTPPSSKQPTVAPPVATKSTSTGEALERWIDDGGKPATPPADRGDFV
jgi:hypothetical protein